MRRRPVSKAFVILSLFALILLGFSGYRGGGADQEDFPNIYIDGATGGVGSEADPYTNLSDINWTTGGDNSIFDYLAGTPSASPTIHLAKAATWRASLAVGCSGTAIYPIVITSYGSGANPKILSSVAKNSTGDWTQDTAQPFIDQSDSDDWWTVTDNTYSQHLKITSSITIHKVAVQVYYDTNPGNAHVEFWTDALMAGDQIGGDSDLVAITDTDPGIMYDFSWSSNQPVLTSDCYMHIRGDSGILKLRSHTDETKYEDTNYDLMAPGDKQADLAFKIYDDIWYASPGATVYNLIFDSEASGATRVTDKVDLDTQGECWWDSGNSRIYLYSASNPATFYNGVIECATDDGIIYATDKSYLTFQNLDLRYTSANGFKIIKDIGSPTDIAIDNCTIKYTGYTSVASSSTGAGIHLYDVDNVTVQNCTISYTANGVHLIYNTDSMTITVDNNDISYNIHGENPSGVAFGSNTSNDPKEFSNSVVSNNTISNFKNCGITLAHASYMVVENNYIHDGIVSTDPGEAKCIGIRSGSQKQHGNIIRYNKIHTLAGAAGLYTGSVGIGTRNSYDDQIYYNVIYDCLKGIWNNALLADGGNDNVVIYNNVCYCDQYGIKVLSGIDADNKKTITLRNNIFQGTSTYDVDIDDYVTATGGYNCLIGDASVNLGTDSTYSGDADDLYETDPLMTDPANGDFTLNPHSPCIDKGTDVSLTEDYQGLKIRHAPDIGAHENQTNVLFFSMIPGLAMPLLFGMVT